MADKKKKIKATSPKGQLFWFKLIKPDTKFKKYTVDLVVDDTPEIRKIIEAMNTAASDVLKEEQEKAKEKKDPKRLKNLSLAKSMPIEPQLNAAGEETGKFVLRFRSKSEGMNKEKEVYSIAGPAIFNAAANPYSAEEKAKLSVFNGSIGQVAFEMVPYALATGDCGVSLRATACMIFKIQQAEADADSFGFAAAEADAENDDNEFEMESKATDQGAKNEDF